MSLDALLNKITIGDARQLAAAIPDESVDVVFTDPPYLKADVEGGIYAWLAQEAARVLRPSGFCFAYTSTLWLPTVLAQMQAHLSFFWLCILRYTDGRSGYAHNQRAIIRYTPIVVCVKGTCHAPTQGKPYDNFLDCATGGGTDKRYHIWGQDERTASYYLDCFTRPGDLVWDPFCGGGMVPAVCKRMNRQFLAFEMDERTAEVARKRLATVQPVLLTAPTITQTSLSLEVSA